MQYRRARVNGGTYFFTVNLANRNAYLLTTHIHALRESVRKVRRAHPFEITAWVVLPEHMHAIWTLPPDDDNYAMRWSRIKSTFSRCLPKQEHLSRSRTAKRERGIWQRRFWEHLITNQDDLLQHVDYIHYNPVKHRHVGKAVDWPYSSFHRFVQNGWLTADWGCSTEFTAHFGERQ